jgi:hypothetical protein
MTDDEADKVFASLADTLMPDAEGMPKASDAADLKAGLTFFLNARPDTRGDIMQGLRLLDGKALDNASLNGFARENHDAWAALTLAIVTTYYNSPKIQALTRYSGAKRHTYDADAVPDFIAEGMLDPVIKRGPVWRKV